WVVRGKDAASRSYPEDTGATENAASRRPARSDGTRLCSVRGSLGLVDVGAQEDVIADRASLEPRQFPGRDAAREERWTLAGDARRGEDEELVDQILAKERAGERRTAFEQ